MSILYTRCRPTLPIPVQCWASVAAHCWFYAEKLFTTLAQRYTNTGSAVYLASSPKQTRAIHRKLLLRRWPNIDTELGDCPVFDWTAMRVTFCSLRRQKSYYPDNRIHWPNTDVMLGDRLCRRANIVPTLSLESLITNIIVNIFFS